eukprot:CAMPEP_0204384058 /NCGR_PEP_ID=MMETSP0469-20131031/56553_1 /ASSEMBLY_ACC=CAM_ASM_000384 /TAXON_ID=2969 /ORGANISM="Oxyrrhis marina" /LENGTH=36 /DNA_ID= /DNA_START= /DNA_END= /DNA_ORIENTATION=
MTPRTTLAAGPRQQEAVAGCFVSCSCQVPHFVSRRV